MPLRDHFRPPLNATRSWEELHGQWPANIVQHLRNLLPKGYIAGPHVHMGSQIEIDVATFEKDDTSIDVGMSEETGGVATAVWAPPRPSLAIETTLPDFDEYEVRIYDERRSRHLVAAIEIVSPGNKDRLEHRNAFIAKCAALLQKGVCVTIVDLVTIRQSNLHVEMLSFLGLTDPGQGDSPSNLYANSCRWVTRQKKTILEAWTNPIALGQPLPTVPLWLAHDRVIPLDLEKCYEQACHDLWIE